MFDSINLRDPLLRGLASAALCSELRSILIFDASPTELRYASRVLRLMLEVTEHSPSIREDTVAINASDDALWGLPSLRLDSGDESFLSPGLVFGGRDHETLQILTIPDLPGMSLATARTAVMAVGAQVIHLERQGQQEQWQPRICWLAACATQDVGKVSPHLLDRFSLRLQSPGNLPPDETEETSRLQYYLHHGSDRLDFLPERLPEPIVEELECGLRCDPVFANQALDQLRKYLPLASSQSIRRDLALGRLAYALARLDGQNTVRDEDVDSAASAIHLRLAVDRPGSASPPLKDETGPKDLEPLPKPETQVPGPGIRESATQIQANDTGETDRVFEPDEHARLAASAFSIGPYPEDNALVDREAMSLHLPLRSPQRASRTNGAIIGTETAQNLRDIAITHTLFEAAKFRAIRTEAPEKMGDNRLIVRSSDLKSYRRAPVPEKMLVLVIDFTALRDCRWQDALVPHLQWAYMERASVALIRIGAVDAAQELRADRLLARNMLLPQLAAALETAPGRATPLAHGLDLALQTLRRALQHGRDNILLARLIVLTDGRGNVPLEASRAGRISSPVGREGIEDALALAAEMRALDRIHKVVLNPQPPQHAELPMELAEVLGAQIISVPLVSELEELAAHFAPTGPVEVG